MSNRGGNELCRVLPWDSSFWGFPIGMVQGQSLSIEHVAEIDRWRQANSIACLFFLSSFDDPETIRVAEKAAFQLMDARVTFKYVAPSHQEPGTGHRPPPASTTIRPADTADVKRLQQIAAVSHRDTRFYFDDNFPRIGCQNLYERWIAESCKSYADHVLVASINNVPSGYVSCHLPARSASAGRIGLIGVAPEARGVGVGRALVQSALAWFAQEGVAAVDVATSGRNTVAQSLYQRCGFVTHSLELWYHKWYSVPVQGVM